MNTELIERIDKALDNIRPFLLEDGGDVEIRSVKSGVLEIELLGNCVSCPMSSMTLKAGIEESVIKAVPEIKEVVAINFAEEATN